MRQNDLVARADEDSETVAKEMVHYNLMIVPVVDERETIFRCFRRSNIGKCSYG